MPDTKPAVVLSLQEIDGVIFDLDGVITSTAAVHFAAWKSMFDDFLAGAAARSGQHTQPFTEDDYRRYVDGKPRYEGVKSFLASRGIELPVGSPDDPPGADSVCALGNRKNAMFTKSLEQGGAEVFDTSVRLVRALKSLGVPVAVVSSSKNCAAVLRCAGLSDLFDTSVDGVEAARLDLPGKPDPDTFLEAARRLSLVPARTAVVEDAIVGVQAGRSGGFGLVIGVDRIGNPEALIEHGANVVVKDLEEIAIAAKSVDDSPPFVPLPSALADQADFASRISGRRIAVFLDYDGTLTPIVERPEQAVLAPNMRATIKRLAEYCTVAVVSGRDLADVRRLVGIEELYYAGSHGFDISGPKGQRMDYQQDEGFLPLLDAAERELQQCLESIEGAQIERKRYSIAIHFRRVAEQDAASVGRAVDKVHATCPQLRKTHGKKVYELQPDIDWHKGRAVRWLLQALDLDGPDVLPLYIGDDVTDEDAFSALRDAGIGIVVMDPQRHSAARYALRDVEEVARFLEVLIGMLKDDAR